MFFIKKVSIFARYFIFWIFTWDIFIFIKEVKNFTNKYLSSRGRCLAIVIFWATFWQKEPVVAERCFQLDIWKEIFRIFTIFKKHIIPRDRWYIYLTKYFLAEIKHLQKRFIVKTTLKNLLFSNRDLWSLTISHYQKTKYPSILRPKERKIPLMQLKILFHVRYIHT